jgi:hypothetical protein
MHQPQRDLTPVGDMLVSYEASQLPTATLESLGHEVIADHVCGARNTRDTVRVLGWLLKISVQKLRALEGDQR